jgi:thioredoxin reductase
MALSLLTWTRDLVVCTDGRGLPPPRELRKLEAQQIALRTEKILRLERRGGRLHRIIFAKSAPLERQGFFFNTAQVQCSPLAAKLGCAFDQQGHVISDRRGRCRVSNLFLAGDCNGNVQFAIVAAAEGASAAVAINTELQAQERRI